MVNDLSIRPGAPGSGAAKNGIERAAATNRLRGTRRTHGATSERTYTDEENEYIRACLSYRQQRGISFLEAIDYLHISKGLGYVRAALS